ncbi:hypothetical protein YC2023_105265 [Brassica napus]
MCLMQFMVKNGVVLTPHADYCLPGITRATVMELVVKENFILVERNISLSEFHTADEVWTTGTMGELSPVNTQSLLYYLIFGPAIFRDKQYRLRGSKHIESMGFRPLGLVSNNHSESTFPIKTRTGFDDKYEKLSTINMKSFRIVVKIDGRVIGEGEVGPVTRKLQSAYKKLTDDSGVPIPTYQKL